MKHTCSVKYPDRTSGLAGLRRAEPIAQTFRQLKLELDGERPGRPARTAVPSQRSDTASPGSRALLTEQRGEAGARAQERKGANNPG